MNVERFFLKVSDYIVDFFLKKDITNVFGYIGGTITHIYDSINKSNVNIVNCISEQGAAFAAEGYARTTGKVGVAMATSGPGATNLITGIGSCFFDSVPVVFLTGQVNTYEYKYDKSIRQIGFQETDIVKIVSPICKYSVMIDDLKMVRYEIEKAFFYTQNGRKGPVLIDIPMNIQRSEIDLETQESFFSSEEFKKSQQTIYDNHIEKVLDRINKSKRPLVLLGGGAHNIDEKLLKLIVEKKLPVVYSLMGKGVISDEYEYNLGLIGSYGNRYGNFAISKCDLLIVLGSRLDSRQTGTNIELFAKDSYIIHVDIDENELREKVNTDLCINSDLNSFLESLFKYDIQVDLFDWYNVLNNLKETFSSVIGIDGNIKVPNLIIEKLSKFVKNKITSVDVGQHQMWVAQSLCVGEAEKVLFSGGMGAMGFSLPVAIGACIGTDKPVVVIVGDGGVQMNIQELEVIKRRNLNIKIFVMNNKNLGMVRQFQEIYFKKDYIGTVDDYSVPNFVNIAHAYDIKAREIKSLNEFDCNVEDIFSSNEPELINIILEDEMTTVEPKLIVNKPLDDMYPFIEKDRLEELLSKK